MKDYIVTVMARDRVGIIRDVSSALSDLGGNITHVNQTVMRGYFTLIVSVEMPDERTQLEIRQAVERNGGVGEFEVNVRPYEDLVAGKASASERFTLSLRGTNQGGVMKRVTVYLADRNINIDDFYAYAYDSKFVMLVQVSIPIGLDVEEIQSELAQVGIEYGLTVNLQHENIFRAISEIRPIMDLQR
ncbi:MAG: glycine cleavage system transcriptional repressor [Armatimonadota bacterium]